MALVGVSLCDTPKVPHAGDDGNQWLLTVSNYWFRLDAHTRMGGNVWKV